MTGGALGLPLSATDRNTLFDAFTPQHARGLRHWHAVVMPGQGGDPTAGANSPGLRTVHRDARLSGGGPAPRADPTGQVFAGSAPWPWRRRALTVPA